MKNYKVISELGSGSFAKVQLAQHLGSGENIAIKTIPKNQIKNKQDMLMVNKEIAVFKSLSHGNLVKLYQVFEDESNLYLVMEYAEKGDLLNYIKNHDKIPEAQALDYMKQLAEAVRYIHLDKGVAHRDIKLANILLSGSDPIVKLADFGLSNFYDRTRPELRTSCGSPCYSAPEILKGRKYDPLAADIWSLGIVLYAMVEGCLPFYHENAKQLYRQVIKGKYAPTEKSSPEIQMLIKQILEVNPSQRIDIRKLIEKLNGISMQRANTLLSIPVLSMQSNNYVESIKIDVIKKILCVRGYSPEEINNAIEYREINNRAYKFNQLNAYIELLNRKPYDKLKKILNELHQTNRYEERARSNQSSFMQTSLSTSKDYFLKRNQSNYTNFTRDTVKDSPREPFRCQKTKFVRSGTPKVANPAAKINNEAAVPVNAEPDGVMQRANKFLTRKRTQTRESNKSRQHRENISMLSALSPLPKQYARLLSSGRVNISRLSSGYIKIKNEQQDNFQSQDLQTANLQEHEKRDPVSLATSIIKTQVSEKAELMAGDQGDGDNKLKAFMDTLAERQAEQARITGARRIKMYRNMSVSVCK